MGKKTSAAALLGLLALGGSQMEDKETSLAPNSPTTTELAPKPSHHVTTTRHSVSSEVKEAAQIDEEIRMQDFADTMNNRYARNEESIKTASDHADALGLALSKLGWGNYVLEKNPGSEMSIIFNDDEGLAFNIINFSVSTYSEPGKTSRLMVSTPHNLDGVFELISDDDVSRDGEPSNDWIQTTVDILDDLANAD